jgi:hypothetical protein
VREKVQWACAVACRDTELCEQLEISWFEDGTQFKGVQIWTLKIQEFCII